MCTIQYVILSVGKREMHTHNRDCHKAETVKRGEKNATGPKVFDSLASNIFQPAVLIQGYFHCEEKKKEDKGTHMASFQIIFNKMAVLWYKINYMYCQTKYRVQTEEKCWGGNKE